MVVGFYNGVRKNKLVVRLTPEGRKSNYKIDNDWAAQDQILDIPQELR
jgi:hypothetical protein